MKLLINIAVLCLPVIVFSQQEIRATETMVNANFTLGRHGADCTGRGLCSFTTALNKAEANTTLFYNNIDNNLTMIIYRVKVSQDDELKIVGKQLTPNSAENGLTFLMDDDLELDSSITAHLKIPSQFTKIAKGTYAVNISKDSFDIRLKLE